MAQPWMIKGLDPEKPVAACVKKIVRTRTKEVLSYRASILKTDDAEAVHDMRVSVRRLKAVLTIFRPWFTPKTRRQHGACLKTLLGALGAVRDKDIYIASLVAFRERLRDVDTPAVDVLIREEQRTKKKLRKHLVKTLRALDTTLFTKILRVRTEVSSIGSHRSDTQPDASFRENARKIVPALCSAFLSQSAEVVSHPAMKKKLHAMRIDGKRLRYGMELFSEIFSAQYGTRLEEIKALLDVMGTIHDCDVTMPVLKRRIEAIRIRNRESAHRTERMRTHGLAVCVRELQQRRRALFAEMTATLTRLDRESFSAAVIGSME